MTKTSRIESRNLNRFMEAMARVLGIPRKRVEKFMFQGQTIPNSKNRAPVRGRSRSSSLAAK